MNKGLLEQNKEMFFHFHFISYLFRGLFHTHVYLSVFVFMFLNIE